MGRKRSDSGHQAGASPTKSPLPHLPVGVTAHATQPRLSSNEAQAQVQEVGAGRPRLNC